MKKLLCVFLSITLLLAALAACQSAPNRQAEGSGLESASAAESAAPSESRDSAGEPEEGEALRVLIDVESGTPWENSSAADVGNLLVDNLKLSGGEIGQVEFEYLPREGEEREAALTHMRTEIMTGKGPDLLICACARPTQDERALFQFPTQVMGRKLFLPLDSYMENAQFTDFDQLLPIAMEAGRNEEGQQLIPLAFTLPMTVFRKSEVEHEHSQTMTRAQQLAGDDAMKLSAAVESPQSVFRSAGFKELADYGAESLTITQEELADYLVEYNRMIYEDYPDAPDNFCCDLAVGFINTLEGEAMFYDSGHHGGLRNTDAFTMVPMYTDEGGYIAYITSFAAINRNTQKAQEAFTLLDYLLSPAGGRSALYSLLVSDVGMPVNMELGTEENPIAYSQTKWYMTQENYQEYCDLRDNISAVRFNTPLEQEIMSAYRTIDSIPYRQSQGENPDSAEKVAADAYRVMGMMLAES